jgi:hypothetical protein
MGISKSTDSTTYQSIAAKNDFKRGKDTAGIGALKPVGLHPKDTAGEGASLNHATVRPWWKTFTEMGETLLTK